MKTFFLKFTFIFTMALISFNSIADETIPPLLSFNLGMTNISVKENADSLTSTDGTVNTQEAPYTGAVSTIPLDISLEYFSQISRSYFIKTGGTFLPSAKGSYYSATLGTNFYMGPVASKMILKDFNFNMQILPKRRYYWGPTIGVGYLSYNTISASKNDVLFEVGGQIGMIQPYKNKWSIRGELALARATGVIASATLIKIMFGMGYSLGN